MNKIKKGDIFMSGIKKSYNKAPWLTQQDEIYIESGAWEAYTDYENWIRKKLGDELADEYDGLSAVFQSNLYGIISDLVLNIK